MSKVYLGDGVYANFDGHALVLTAEDGHGFTNEIVLERTVYNNLLYYIQDVKRQRQEMGLEMPQEDI